MAHYTYPNPEGMYSISDSHPQSQAPTPPQQYPSVAQGHFGGFHHDNYNLHPHSYLHSQDPFDHIHEGYIHAPIRHPSPHDLDFNPAAFDFNTFPGSDFAWHDFNAGLYQQPVDDLNQAWQDHGPHHGRDFYAEDHQGQPMSGHEAIMAGGESGSEVPPQSSGRRRRKGYRACQPCHNSKLRCALDKKYENACDRCGDTGKECIGFRNIVVRLSQPRPPPEVQQPTRPKKTWARTAQACEACRKAKLRCEPSESGGCKRCQKQGIRCVMGEDRRLQQYQGGLAENQHIFRANPNLQQQQLSLGVGRHQFFPSARLGGERATVFA